MATVGSGKALASPAITCPFVDLSVDMRLETPLRCRVGWRLWFIALLKERTCWVNPRKGETLKFIHGFMNIHFNLAVS